MEDWKKIEEESKFRKSLRERFKLLGKRARRYKEEGVIVISSLKPKLNDIDVIIKKI
jgi:hypothetical protein